jgi:hypothetical protein
MAEKIISPNVFVNESDKSLVSRGPVVTGAAIVGPTVKGRPLVPIVVTSYSEYVSIFGDQFKSGSQYYEYFTSLAAKEYFSGGGNSLLVTRIVSGSAYNTYAQANVVTSITSGSAKATGSGIIANAFTSNNEIRVTYGSSVYRFISEGDPIPSDDVDGNLYFFSTGSTAAAGALNLATEINGALSGSAATATNLLVASASSATLIISASAGGTAYNGITVATGSASSFSTLITLNGGTNSVTEATSFILESKNYGAESNNTSSISSGGALASGSTSNIRWEVVNINDTKGTFTLLIRRGDDNTSTKNILETWSNLSLDPQQPNFISRQIGDEKSVYVAAVGSESAYVQLTGSFTGGSQYVRVASIATLHADSIDNDGNFKATLYSGSLPTNGSGSYGGSFNGGIAATSRVGLFFDEITPSAASAQGFIDEDYQKALTLLSNKDEYDFNLLLTPGLFLSANPNISDPSAISTAEARGDAFAIQDLVAYGDTKANAISAAAASTSNYGAGYWPWVQTFSANLGRPVWVPPSVVMGGVYAFNDVVGAEWFAPAGLNRGGIGSVIRAEKRLSANDRDDLYEANVNPLATFPGVNGVVAFGQKTFQKRATSLDRVNVRRLLINLKRFITSVSRQLVFEQNTAVTRNRFLSVVNPYMEQVVSRQGLFAYKVIMDEANNTADVIDRNQLIGQIYVQPTKTAEFIILDFTLQPTGAAFPA